MNTEVRNTRFEQKEADWLPLKRLQSWLAAFTATGLVLVFAAVIQASEIAGSPQAEASGWNVPGLGWIIGFPLAGMILYSLIVNKRKGWGWVAVGTTLVLLLLILQLIWSIITSFRGDPGDDEDYFKPLDSWTSDSF